MLEISHERLTIFTPGLQVKQVFAVISKVAGNLNIVPKSKMLSVYMQHIAVHLYLYFDKSFRLAKIREFI